MESNSFDHLELKFALLPKGTASVPGAHLLKFSVLINGINISPENVIDLSELIASLKSSGSFNIVTCVCGEAGCIGESQGVSVNHGLSTIVWNMPDKIVYNSSLPTNANLSLSKIKQFEFDSAQVILSVKNALFDAKIMLDKNEQAIQLEPFGFVRKQLHYLSDSI